MVGDLYNDPRYSDRRDAAFSLFYMAINIGSMFAPMAATAMCKYALNARGLVYDGSLPGLCNQLLDGDNVGDKIASVAASCGMQVGTSVEAFASHYITVLSTGYSYGFGVACASMVVGFLIYYCGRRTFASVISQDKGQKTATASVGPELTPAQVRQRVMALIFVFAVVIFFWMVFSQNGATLTEFAKSCTASEAGGWTRVGFNVWALAAAAVAIYALFSLFQSETTRGRIVSGVILLAMGGVLAYFYSTTSNPITGIQPQEFQMFNPFFVVALTPVSLAIFSWLAKRKKDPSAPRKIGYGMLMAACAYAVMMIGSFSIIGTSASVSANWLISTYLVLTFAELLLSPMGISFVSKVAPPKLKGSMMGGWFASTAIGNYLVSIPMLLWGKIPVWTVWAILIGLCLLSAGFIFAMMKKLESATADTPVVKEGAV